MTVAASSALSIPHFSFGRKMRKSRDQHQRKEHMHQHNNTHVESSSDSVTAQALRRLADNASDRIAERTKAGMRAKAETGGTVGRAPIGYYNTCTTNDHGHHRSVAIDPKCARLVQWAFWAIARQKVQSLHDLHRQVEDFGLTTRPTTKRPARPLTIAELHRLLTNPYYLGNITFDGETFPGNHPPLVEEHIWDTVQERLTELAADNIEDPNSTVGEQP